MTTDLKQVFDRVQKAQRKLTNHGFEGLSLQLDVSGNGCVHVWAHRRSNGKTNTRGFVLYDIDANKWRRVNGDTNEFNSNVMISKLSQFLGFDI